MDDLQKYRAALVAVGAMYEDYDGPLTEAQIEAAKRIIAEQESQQAS